MPRRRAGPEQQLQRAVVQYLRVALPERMGVAWYAVPMGGVRSAVEAAIFKGLGSKAGIPDLAFIANGKPFFIELKSASGRLSKAQSDMINRLRMAGAETYLCRSIEDVQRCLKAEGIEPAGRCA